MQERATKNEKRKVKSYVLVVSWGVFANTFGSKWWLHQCTVSVIIWTATVRQATVTFVECTYNIIVIINDVLPE